MDGRKERCPQAAGSSESGLSVFSLGYFNLYPSAVMNHSQEYVTSQRAQSGLRGAPTCSCTHRLFPPTWQ